MIERALTSLTRLRSSTLVTASVWSVMIRLCGMGVSFLLGVLLARSLGPASYGIYGVFSTILGLLGSVALLGLPQIAVRELSAAQSRQDFQYSKSLIKRFTVYVAVSGGVLGLVVFLIAHGFGGKLGSEVRNAAFWCAILVPLTALIAVRSAALRGLSLLIKGQIADILLRPLFTLLICFGAIWVGVSLKADTALALHACAVLICFGAVEYWVRRTVSTYPEPLLSKSRPNFRLISALPMWGVDTIRQLDGSIAMVMIGWFASDYDAGLFKVAAASAVFIALPVTVLHVILAPTVSSLYSRRDFARLQRVLAAAASTMLMAVGVGVLTIILAGQKLIEIAFGSEYSGSWLPLVLMSIPHMVYAFFGMGPILLAMTGSERVLVKIYVSSCLLSAGAAIALVPSYGPAGGALVGVVSSLVVCLASWLYGIRRLGVDTSLFGLFRIDWTS